MVREGRSGRGEDHCHIHVIHVKLQHRGVSSRTYGHAAEGVETQIRKVMGWLRACRVTEAANMGKSRSRGGVEVTSRTP